MAMTIYTILSSVNFIILVILVNYGFTRIRKELFNMHLRMQSEFATVKGVIFATHDVLMSVDEDEDEENDGGISE